MTTQLYRFDVFPRLAFHPENAAYVGTSYRLKATGPVDAEKVKAVLSDPLAEVCALPSGVNTHGHHVLDVQFAPGVTDNAAKTAEKTLAWVITFWPFTVVRFMFCQTLPRRLSFLTLSFK